MRKGVDIYGTQLVIVCVIPAKYCNSVVAPLRLAKIMVEHIKFNFFKAAGRCDNNITYQYCC
jgi:hypothetical protein